MTLNRRVLRRVHSPLRSPFRSNTSLRKKALIKQISGEVQFGADSKANLKVVVRVRPLNQREQDNNASCVVDVVDEHMLVFDPRREEDDFFFKGARQRTRDLNKRQNREQKFAFERVFSSNSTNEQLYQATTHSLLDTLLNGYNCSVFAYGATGAGKTFTMSGTVDCPGITFLTLIELYKRIENIKNEKMCEVAVSYLEVYNETVRDLLHLGKPLSLQEVGQQVVVPGLSLHKPTGTEELMQMLARGNMNRTQHPTDSNSESSRSHAVFQVFVKQQEPVLSGLKSNVSISKLSMIDLAGSERGAATSFKGVRFREGASINKSLLALGNCINGLADGQRHIPYRDSKLTRLLKDSLGGNCRSVMIAAVSPASTTFEDTFNTLRYANRAKTIKTTIKKNLLNVDQHVSNYVKIVTDLQEEVCSLKAKIKKYEEKEAEWEQERATLSSTPSPLSELTPQERLDLEAQIADLQDQLKTSSETEGVTREEAEVSEAQQRLEEASREYRGLRCELLRLESAQREVQFKKHACTTRLNRMKVISFASQKLDKSIARCQRILRNLDTRLAQIEPLKQKVEGCLSTSLACLQQLQHQEASTLPHHLPDKLQAKMAVAEYQQYCQYLGRMVGEGMSEQSASEQLISQLLHATRQFYVQLRADNQCTPPFSHIFQCVVENLDESKIVWADQQGSGEDVQGSDMTIIPTTLPHLDVAYLTQLPIASTIFISPTVTQDQPRPRKSSLKSSSSCSTPQELPQVSSWCLASTHNSRLTTFHSPVFEETASQDEFTCTTPITYVPQKTIPTSPVLSTFSLGIDHVGGRQLGMEKSPSLPVIHTHLPMLPARIDNMSPLTLSTTKTPSPHIWAVPQDKEGSQLSEMPSLGPVSMMQQCGVSASDVTNIMNTTELLEDIQPVDYSMNATFSVTPSKVFETTMDLPSHSSLLSQLTPGKALNTTMDMASHSSILSQLTPGKALNTNMDVCNPLSILSQHKPVAPNIITVSSSLSTLTVPFVKSDVAIVPQFPSVANMTLTETNLNSIKKMVTVTATDIGMCSLTPNVSSEPKCLHIASSCEKHEAPNLQDPAHCTKTTSRKLFQSSQPPLDSTFSVGDNAGISELADTLTAETEPSSGSDVVQQGRSIGLREVPQVPLQHQTTKRDKPFGPHHTAEPSKPPFTKVKLLNKRMTPHKPGFTTTTPGKTSSGWTRTTTTQGRSLIVGGGMGAMRRSVSTPSLVPAPTAKASKPSPSFKRKLSGMGGVLHRTSSIRMPLVSNQENVPPGSTRKNGGQSSIHCSTMSSAAKHALAFKP